MTSCCTSSQLYTYWKETASVPPSWTLTGWNWVTCASLNQSLEGGVREVPRSLVPELKVGFPPNHMGWEEKRNGALQETGDTRGKVEVCWTAKSPAVHYSRYFYFMEEKTEAQRDRSHSPSWNTYLTWLLGYHTIRVCLLHHWLLLHSLLAGFFFFWTLKVGVLQGSILSPFLSIYIHSRVTYSTLNVIYT